MTFLASSIFSKFSNTNIVMVEREGLEHPMHKRIIIRFSFVSVFTYTRLKKSQRRSLGPAVR